MMHFIKNHQLKPITQCLRMDIRRVIGGNRKRLQILVLTCVFPYWCIKSMELFFPLSHKVQGWHHDEGWGVYVLDNLQRQNRLTRTGRHHDDPSLLQEPLFQCFFLVFPQLHGTGQLGARNQIQHVVFVADP